MKYQFPDTYGERCILLPVDSALLPLVAGALRPFEQRYSWESDEDYELGYNAFAELQASMANTCIADLAESNRQIYRLLDATLNGTAYSASPDPANPGQQLVAPSIPAAPAATPPTSPTALRAQLRRLHQLAENAATGAVYGANGAMDDTVGLNYDGSWAARIGAVQGQIDAGWFGIGGQRPTLAHLVEALRIGSSSDAGRIDTALEALQAASSMSVVFSTVQDLLADVVSGGLEGATLGTLIASSLANAAAQGIIAGQLDRIITALDGGGVSAPDDNVLDELDAIKVQLS